MKKEDFKIEIIEQIYQNGDVKFVPNIYVECNNFNKFETFCNKFVANLFTSVRIDKYKIYSTANEIWQSSYNLMPEENSVFGHNIRFNNFDTAIKASNDAIDTYLIQIASKTIIETKIHKI